MAKKPKIDVTKLFAELTTLKSVFDDAMCAVQSTISIWCLEHHFTNKEPVAVFREAIEAIRDKTNLSLEDLSNKIALLVKLTTVFNKRLTVFDDNAEVLEMLSEMYNDETLEGIVNKYALGESISQLAGLHDVAVEFSQALSDVLGIVIEEEYDDMEDEEPIRKELMGGRTPFSERATTDVETLVEEAINQSDAK